ncbi:SDR family NAD(P)-dependent oxidoreductase [archaeon]|nr:MAG: SDR family NAD(P)-dependent oxidoreductase [archaeon]
MASASRGVALITGANRGLGFALARSLARAGGWKVVAAARNWTTGGGTPGDALLGAAAVTARLPTARLGEMNLVSLDVTSADSRYALHDSLARLLGADTRLDAVINVAGVMTPGWSADALASCCEVNTWAPAALAEELVPFYAPGAQVVCVLPRAVAGGERRRARSQTHAHADTLTHAQRRACPTPARSRLLCYARVQINVSTGYSRLALLPADYADAIKRASSVDELRAAMTFRANEKLAGDKHGAYRISKAALNRITQLQAKSLAGVARVNAVDPGWCRTDMYVARARVPVCPPACLLVRVGGPPPCSATPPFPVCAGVVPAHRAVQRTVRTPSTACSSVMPPSLARATCSRPPAPASRLRCARVCRVVLL